MDSMNAIVARNIKRLRSEKNISLDELARLSSVSKSMLAQIERGEGNPTISTLWKISNGMGLPFDALVARPQTRYDLLRKDEVQPLYEDGGRFINFPIFPDDGSRHFSDYAIILEEGCASTSQAHLKGTQEFITVYEGELEVEAEGEVFRLCEGDSLRFHCDCTHSYRNVGKGRVRLHMIIYNP